MKDFSQLTADSAAVRDAVATARAGLVEREVMAEVVALCAVARQHLLVVGVGQPGNPPYLKNLPPEHAYRLLASGDAHALASAKDTTTTVEIGLGTSAGQQVRATFPNIGQGDVGMREHAGTITLWHRDGRILVATASELLASLRLAR